MPVPTPSINTTRAVRSNRIPKRKKSLTAVHFNCRESDLSNMWKTSALVELLERKGVLTKQEVLDMIHERRRYHLHATM